MCFPEGATLMPELGTLCSDAAARASWGVFPPPTQGPVAQLLSAALEMERNKPEHREGQGGTITTFSKGWACPSRAERGDGQGRAGAPRPGHRR